MCEHTEEALACAAVVGAAEQGAAESAFVPAEGALGLPPLAVHPLVPAPLLAGAEVTGHLGTIRPVRRAFVPAGVDRNHTGPDPQTHPCEPVVLFGIECGIGQHPVPGDAQRGQQECGCELG